MLKPNYLPITVLGAGGWVGSALVDELTRQGRAVLPVERAELVDWLAAEEQLGPVVYAIGLTADFRQRPYATVDAHVGLVSKVLRRTGLERLLLLSSTRVYSRSIDTSESASLPCQSSDASDLYNISKLLGECLVLQDPRPGLKVVRLSNVLGFGQPESTFVGSLLFEARERGEALIEQSSDSTKDYVALSDVVRLLPLIAEKGNYRLYNLASGKNTTHAELATWLGSAGLTVRFDHRAVGGFKFPQVKIERLAKEFEPPGDPFLQNPLKL